MGRNMKNKKRLAAIIVAAFLVIVMLLGTIAPFFVHAGVAAPVSGGAVETAEQHLYSAGV